MPSIKTNIAFGMTTMTSQMMMPKAFHVNTKMYYYADELKTFCPKFFIGTSKTIRVIIERKKIPEYDYIYAIKGPEWNIMDATSKKAKLLISKNWVDINFNADEPKVVKPKVVKANKTVEIVPVVVDVVNSDDIIPEIIVVNSDDEDVDIVDVVDEILEEAPPIFELNDEEKFKDVDGNVLEIETRGERHHNKIYFKVKDVADSFGMKNLNSILLHKEKGYERNVDYKLLNLKGLTQVGKKTTNKPRLYLTYEGMLRMLFVSRNANATFFRKWATSILFTHQMGTSVQREELGADLLKMSLKQLKTMLKVYAGKFSCIYLLELGTVSSLRNLFSISLDIPDDVIVYKYGFTDDIVRRLTEHTKDYGNLKGVNVYLSTFTFIDEAYMSIAETEIKHLCNAFGKALVVDGRNELVALNMKEFKQIKKQYGDLGCRYSGSNQGLQNMIDGLKTEMFKNDMGYENKITLKDTELKLMCKELEHNIINNRKDMEIVEIKLNSKDVELNSKNVELKCKDFETQLYIEISKNKDFKINELQSQIEMNNRNNR